MDNIGFLKELFDQKIINIIRMFLVNPNRQFYLKEISDNVGVAIASSHRILKRLTKIEVIKETNISKFKVYQLAENERVNYLKSFFKESIKVLEIFIKEIEDVKGVRTVILHGKENATRANILLIGEGIDVSEVKRIVNDLKEQYDYSITHMSLTNEQYEQMSSMGLYSGTKKILFER